MYSRLRGYEQVERTGDESRAFTPDLERHMMNTCDGLRRKNDGLTRTYDGLRKSDVLWRTCDWL